MVYGSYVACLLRWHARQARQHQYSARTRAPQLPIAESTVRRFRQKSTILPSNWISESQKSNLINCTRFVSVCCDMWNGTIHHWRARAIPHSIQIHTRCSGVLHEMRRLNFSHFKSCFIRDKLICLLSQVLDKNIIEIWRHRNQFFLLHCRFRSQFLVFIQRFNRRLLYQFEFHLSVVRIVRILTFDKNISYIQFDYSKQRCER